MILKCSLMVLLLAGCAADNGISPAPLISPSPEVTEEPSPNPGPTPHCKGVKVIIIDVKAHRRIIEIANYLLRTQIRSMFKPINKDILLLEALEQYIRNQGEEPQFKIEIENKEGAN